MKISKWKQKNKLHWHSAILIRQNMLHCIWGYLFILLYIRKTKPRRCLESDLQTDCRSGQGVLLRTDDIYCTPTHGEVEVGVVMKLDTVSVVWTFNRLFKYLSSGLICWMDGFHWISDKWFFIVPFGAFALGLHWHSLIRHMSLIHTIFRSGPASHSKHF